MMVMQEEVLQLYLHVSDAPAWVTAAGSLGSFSGASAIATQTLTCTDAVSFTVSPSPIVAGITFTTGVGSCTITGTQTATHNCNYIIILQ